MTTTTMALALEKAGLTPPNVSTDATETNQMVDESFSESTLESPIKKTALEARGAVENALKSAEVNQKAAKQADEIKKKKKAETEKEIVVAFHQKKEAKQEQVQKMQAAKKAAEAKKQEAVNKIPVYEELLKNIAELESMEQFLDETGAVLLADFRQQKVALETDEYFQVALDQYRQKKHTQEVERQKKRREKQVQDEKNQKISRGVFDWLGKGGSNTIGVVIRWAGPNIATGAIRGVNGTNKKGEPIFTITAIRGDVPENLKVGKSWVADEKFLPKVLQKKVLGKNPDKK